MVFTRLSTGPDRAASCRLAWCYVHELRFRLNEKRKTFNSGLIRCDGSLVGTRMPFVGGTDMSVPYMVGVRVRTPDKDVWATGYI